MGHQGVKGLLLRRRIYDQEVIQIWSLHDRMAFR